MKRWVFRTMLREVKSRCATIPPSEVFLIVGCKVKVLSGKSRP